jgi:hypothetical protein
MLPAEYLNIRREFIDVLQFMSHDALKVFLCLIDRNNQQKDIKVGLSVNELARQADVSVHACRRALAWLESPNINDKDIMWASSPFIHVKTKGKHHVITVDNYYIGEDPTHIPFTYDDTDATKIAVAEKEVRRLQVELKREMLGQRSGLAEVLQGEERDAIIEIEQRQGIGLSRREAYFVGKAMAKFGPERVKSTFRRMQQQKNPIRAMYASLSKGIAGKGAEEKPQERSVKVRELR